MGVDASYTALKALLRGMGGVLVAFSGGVDSSLLLAAAYETLGDRAVAATGVSATFSPHDRKVAREVVSQIGARWITVETDELADPCFRSNPHNRCYHCKTRLFTLLLDVAKRESLPYVVEGANVDDLKDFRPGLQAAREKGIRSPFIELGIGKSAIRAFARDAGLSNWDRPSSACLSSRIPYGEEITTERLQRIARSEESIRRLGFSQVRVRDCGMTARIEIDIGDFSRIVEPKIRNAVVDGCKDAGYRHVTLDLCGYRTGAMNEDQDLPMPSRKRPPGE